jgi:cyclophilin family peptidyl-prolyl cis-trans isomerase/HEAT repeat protein
MFNAQILEAVGKTGMIKDLIHLATVKTYRSTDTLLLLGQARAIFRMALRNITAPEGTSRMVDLLPSENSVHDIRLYAAQYLARAKNIDVSLAKIRLTDIFVREKNPDIRMSLATCFGNHKDSLFLPALKTVLSREEDYRVQTQIIRALSQYPYPDIKDVLLPYLTHKNIHVAMTAAQGFERNGLTEDVPLYMEYDNDSIPWQVRAPMNGAVLAHTALYYTRSKNVMTAKIMENFKNESQIYGKAAYIMAMAKDPYNYKTLIQVYDENKESILKSAAIDGLADILKNPLFFKAFGNNFGRVKSDILEVLVRGISSGDVAQISKSSSILKEEKLQWNYWVKDFDFIDEALSKLSLPRDIETYNDLASCKAFLKNEKYTPQKPEFNHPVPWEFLNTQVGDSSIAAIKTNKGLIRVQLFKHSAPGTVSNFVKLIEDKFYNGKIFHRVVPNFVIQTGCPRGDGYGSLDYTIRSELPPMYYNSEGYIGMASSGIHTEGTQWFITHSPAPHLDGRYTIFGKVIEGMDVVHSITQGDKINEIIFVK